MEDAGLVGSILEDSPRGPQRKEYALRRSVSVTIDLTPNLFRARIFSFGAVPGTQQTDEQTQAAAQINEAIRAPEESGKFGTLAHVVAEVDRKLKQMEEERAVLLYLRNLALREAVRASGTLGDADRRRMARYLMREQREGIEDMSASLGLRQATVGEILVEIEKQLFATSQ